MHDAGINISVFGAHSVRGASASIALQNNAPNAIPMVRKKAVSWKASIYLVIVLSTVLAMRGMIAIGR